MTLVTKMLGTTTLVTTTLVTTTLVTLKRRSEFLAVRGGARWSTPSLLLEGKMRQPAPDTGLPEASSRRGRKVETTVVSSVSVRATRGAGAPVAINPVDANPARFGFTVTKKLGTAVVRNRIRRRLREILRQGIVKQGLAGCDYVIVAREAALRRPPEVLCGDLETALAQVNRRLKSPPASRR